MIQWLKERPSEFKHLEEDHEYLAVTRTAGMETKLCAFLAIRVDGSGVGIIHIHPIRSAWSHNTLKQFKADWPFIVGEFRAKGCHRLMATGVPASEHFTWWERFIRHFGFPEPKPVYFSCQEV